MKTKGAFVRDCSIPPIDPDGDANCTAKQPSFPLITLAPQSIFLPYSLYVQHPHFLFTGSFGSSETVSANHSISRVQKGRGKKHEKKRTIKEQPRRIENEPVTARTLANEIGNLPSSLEPAKGKKALVLLDSLTDELSRSCFSLGFYDDGLLLLDRLVN
jgi:hypothetical protein